jgi:hypothetical protein
MVTDDFTDNGHSDDDSPLIPRPIANVLSETLTPMPESVGCQCQACQQLTPEERAAKKHKQGRHHKACQCPKCLAKSERSLDPFQPSQLAQVDYKGLANVVFEMSTGTLCTLFGPEWQPRVSTVTLQDGSKLTHDEKAVVTSALAKYLESKEVKDVPPGVMLCFVVAAYSLPRFKEPTTRDKIGAIYSKGKALVARAFKPLFNRKQNNSD